MGGRSEWNEWGGSRGGVSHLGVHAKRIEGPVGPTREPCQPITLKYVFLRPFV